MIKINKSDKFPPPGYANERTKMLNKVLDQASKRTLNSVHAWLIKNEIKGLL